MPLINVKPNTYIKKKEIKTVLLILNMTQMTDCLIHKSKYRVIKHNYDAFLLNNLWNKNVYILNTYTFHIKSLLKTIFLQ